MSDYLDDLGRQLRLATDRHHRDQSTQVASLPRKVSPRLILLVTLALLLLAATAWAATAVLQTGSPVAPPRGSSAAVGTGIPARGSAHLLAIRAPDPAGGPPWGMRVTRTTRGLLCVQVGRVYRGQLGLLGRDGAFADDGRFHRLPVNALSASAWNELGPAGNIQTCVFPATTFSQSMSGIALSGALSHASVPVSEQRWISYGLLGSHAQAVGYRGLSRVVLRPLGAYLIVLAGPQPGHPGPQGGGSSGAGQINTPRPQPSGAITTINYRFGDKQCTDASRPGAMNTCPTGRWPLPPAPRRSLGRPVIVRLEPHHGTVDASVSFRAPYRVTSALSGYLIEIPGPCHRGAGGATLETSIDRDIAAGQRVSTRIDDIFANACGSKVTLRVLYATRQQIDPFGAGVVVGQTTIRRGRQSRG